MLDAVRSSFGLSSGAEVTTEANPESTSPEFFAGILRAGYNRVSLGAQSVAPTCSRCSTASTPRPSCGRRHRSPSGRLRAPQPRPDLRHAGERPDDLQASLDAVLDAGVDHVSAYALIIEEGTAIARRINRGELPAPDDDTLAERYEQVDSVLSTSGFKWYEVSNWAASPPRAAATTSATGEATTGGEPAPEPTATSAESGGGT
ncbi:hypothetical protein GCM10029964_020730 [Kibdelosporangium lantanae]